MGRAKLRMELIAKEKTRNTTYQKRKQGLVKKAIEFSILCAVDTAVIIYPPNSNVPEIWPENPEKVKNIISTYNAKKSECGKRTYDINDFFQDRKKKIEEELAKAKKRNMEAKYATWFDELNNLSEGQLRQFAIGLENKQNMVRAQIELKKRKMAKFEVERDHIGHFQMPFYADAPVSLDQAQMVSHGSMMGFMANHQNGLGLGFDCGPSTSVVPLRVEPATYDHYGQPFGMVDGGMGNNDLNSWSFHPFGLQPMMAPFAQYGSNPNVGNHGPFDGVWDFVTNDHMGRFIG